eukprot:5442987-Prymnesium_polylepis.2
MLRSAPRHAASSWPRFLPLASGGGASSCSHECSASTRMESAPASLARSRRAAAPRPVQRAHIAAQAASVALDP